MTALSPLARLIRYGRRYRTQVWLAATCSVLNRVFDLAPPLLIGLAVDTVVEGQSSLLANWGLQSIAAQLLVLSGLTLIVWGLESVFEYAYARLWRSLAQTIQHELRLEAYAHLQDLELAFFEDSSTGRLLSILNDDVNQLERFLDVGATEILQTITTVVVVGGAFFILAPGIAWMAMLPMPFILWGSLVFQRSLAPRYAEVRQQVGQLNSRLANNLSGITTIKSFTTETYEIDRVRSDSDAYRTSNRKAIALSAAFVPLIRIVILVGFTATLYFGGLAAAGGTLAVGTYSVLVFITQRLLWPLTALGNTLDQYQRAMASTTRVLDLLDTPVAIRSGYRDLRLDTVKGALRLENLGFAYGDGSLLFKGLSLTVPAGHTIGVVGATGSGKSTLVKLLLRFYELDVGRITLDGIDISEIRLQDLRRAIGLVSQDVFLFDGTVAENIAYGSPDAQPAASSPRCKNRRGSPLHRNAPPRLRHHCGGAGAKALGRAAAAAGDRPSHSKRPANFGARRGDLRRG